MNISSIVMARAIAFVEVEELNPRGKAFYPDIVEALVKRFSFQGYPKALEDFDETKGIQFTDGRFSDGTVDRMQIFTHGLVLDTRVSTDVSEKLLQDTLLWASSELGVHFEEQMIKRRAFISQVTFESDMKMSDLNPVLGRIGSWLSRVLSEKTGQPLTYETTSVILNVDQGRSKMTPGLFSIERRAELPFSDNKYFSSAPLSTADHIGILKDFEKTLKSAA